MKVQQAVLNIQQLARTCIVSIARSWSAKVRASESACCLPENAHLFRAHLRLAGGIVVPRWLSGFKAAGMYTDHGVAKLHKQADEFYGMKLGNVCDMCVCCD